MFRQRNFYFSKMFRQRKFHFRKMFRQRKFYENETTIFFKGNS